MQLLSDHLLEQAALKCVFWHNPVTIRAEVGRYTGHNLVTHSLDVVVVHPQKYVSMQ